MIKNILHWFTARATLKNLVLSLMAVIPFNLIIFPFLTGQIRSASGGVGTLDVTPGYLPDAAQQMIEAYTPQGRNLYLLTEWTADLIFPLAYTLFFSFLLAFVYKHAFPEDSPFQNLRWASPLMMIFDYLENITVSILLIIYPNFPMLVAVLASVSSLLKWVFGITAGIALLAGGAALLLQLFSPPRRKGD